MKKAEELLAQGYMDVKKYARREAGSCCSMSSIRSKGSDNHKPISKNARPAMTSRSLQTAYELRDMIVEQARALHGPWPAGMTLFVFEDAYGWTASISRPASEADNIYRTCTLDLITALRTRYDLDVPRPSEPDDIC